MENRSLDDLMINFESAFDEGKVDSQELQTYEHQVHKLLTAHKQEPFLHAYKLYEAQALLYMARGKADMAQKILYDARSIMDDADQFVTKGARKWDERKNNQVYPAGENSRIKNASVGVTSWIVFICAIVLSRGLAEKYPSITFTVLLVALTFWLGTIYGEKYLTKSYINTSYLGKLFWSNAYLWLIPFLGGFSAGATIKINKGNFGDDRLKYMTLGYIGIIASVSNAILGTIIASR